MMNETPTTQPAGKVLGYVSKTGHGTYYRETITPALAALEHGGRKMWTPLVAAALLRQWPDAAPVAWYVERVAPGKRDNGMRLGPFWKLEDAQEWCDERHELRELYAAPPAAQPAANPCGAPAVGGPCILPAGHNMGCADVPANHQAQPAGMVLVPRAPTPEMLGAGMAAGLEHYRQTIDAGLADGPEPVYETSTEASYRAMIAASPSQPAAPAVEPLTPRELELIDGMIEVQLHHARQCDGIANRVMADKQKGWDMERVALLRKVRGITQGEQQ